MGRMLGLIECYIHYITAYACMHVSRPGSELPCITQHAHMQTQVYAHPYPSRTLQCKGRCIEFKNDFGIKWNSPIHNVKGGDQRGRQGQMAI